MTTVAPKFDTHIIKNKAQLIQLFKYSEGDFEHFVLDVETDSEVEVKANLYGIGVAFVDNEAFYIPWRTQSGEEIWDVEIKNAVRKWLMRQAKTKRLVGHNIIYDLIVLERTLEVDLTPYLYSDTILQKHTLEEEPPFALKEVSVLKLGSWADKAQDELKESVIANGGKFTKTKKDMYLAETDILGTYCCWDVILTLKLHLEFEQQLKDEELYDFFYNQEVMELYKHCTIPMKRNGFPVDVEYFTKLNNELTEEITNLEDTIMKNIEQDVKPFEKSILQKMFPMKKTGNFPKKLAEIIGVPLPQTKSGKITLSAKPLEKAKELNPQFNYFYDWLTDKKNPEIEEPSELAIKLYGKISKVELDECRRALFFEKNPDAKYVFNLKSNDHLGYWLFTALGHSPKELTDTGKPKVNMTYLESIKDEEPDVALLLDLKKLNKLQSTYIQGILDRQINGKIYASMLQFGTTSGRYSSANPNLQNLPRPRDKGFSELVLKYTNAIRAGFIAPKGYKIVDADYSSLEPRCFSHVSGDEKLRNVFINGEDLYSRIAIDVFKLTDVSANPEDENYLGAIDKEFRQKAKVFTLAVPYGAEAPRIAQAMKVDFHEAEKIINAYLRAYPGLKKFMFKSNFEAKTKGRIKTEFGRVRHLGAAHKFYRLYGDDLLEYYKAKRKDKLKERREFKNLLNNAKNFQIQGLAAHIMNRAMIEIAKEFKNQNIDGYIALQVHDQCVCIVSDSNVEKAKAIVQDKMENTTKISVPMIAEPQIATNLRDSH